MSTHDTEVSLVEREHVACLVSARQNDYRGVGKTQPKIGITPDHRERADDVLATESAEGVRTPSDLFQKCCLSPRADARREEVVELRKDERRQD